MSRKKRPGSHSGLQGLHKTPSAKNIHKDGSEDQLLSRRNLLKAGIAGLLGVAGATYWVATRERDRTVFDEQSGNGSKQIDCYKQIHHGDALAVMAKRQPSILEYFVHHQRGILQHLTKQLSQDPQTVYVLEGCNPYMQGQMRANQDFSQTVRAVGNMLETDPAKAVDSLVHASRRATVEELGGVLAASEATAQFVIRKARNDTRIFGTEPNQDEFVMWTDFIRKEIAALADAQRTGELTDQLLEDAAQRINDRKIEEIQIRNTYMRDTLSTELRDGGHAQVVLGAGHFRSGSASITKPVDSPIEDELLQLPDSRVRVVEQAQFTRLRDLVRAVPQQSEINSRTLRMLVERENKR